MIKIVVSVVTGFITGAALGAAVTYILQKKRYEKRVEDIVEKSSSSSYSEDKKSGRDEAMAKLQEYENSNESSSERSEDDISTQYISKKDRISYHYGPVTHSTTFDPSVYDRLVEEGVVRDDTGETATESAAQSSYEDIVNDTSRVSFDGEERGMISVNVPSFMNTYTDYDVDEYTLFLGDGTLVEGSPMDLGDPIPLGRFKPYLHLMGEYEKDSLFLVDLDYGRRYEIVAAAGSYTSHMLGE